MIVAFGLFYYGAAWAVLRCAHDGEDSDQEVALFNGDPLHLDFECGGPNFHTEALAETSSPPQLGRWMPEVTRHVNDFFTFETRPGEAANDIWLRAVFDRVPALAFLIGLPSYLFLSVLRI
ncbi:MAG TPA: hypothetical protein VLJ79_11260 [Candidatus Binatia bacterium]|nr:hypothetical protein [Candidatus Binatia bacterium]